jgi:hypothetical protein
VILATGIICLVIGFPIGLNTEVTWNADDE